ncbi:hypothetical protein NC651_039739 [Populus alba x Populus x berolinensis]|nr:hypothetical protein NC651_039739 [Populus alba x Populus x berolinensis]
MAVIWEKVPSLPAPRQIYTSLDLSNNQLSGDVPDSIGGLKSLKLLSISLNKLSGRTPISFGDLESLESLDLSHNTLERTTTNVRKAFANYSLGIEANNKFITWFSWKMMGIGFPFGFVSTISAMYVSGYFQVANSHIRAVGNLETLNSLFSSSLQQNKGIKRQQFVVQAHPLVLVLSMK